MTEIIYLRDEQVTPAQDVVLRDLLRTCFSGPGDATFEEKRWVRECPAHRWMVWEDGRLAAHLAVHEKQVIIGGQQVPVGGVAEVAVHPEWRRRGLVREMLQVAHQWMREQGWDWSLLFGRREIYSSSGYFPDPELEYHEPGKPPEMVEVMVHELGARKWPRGQARLIGLTF